MDYGNGSTAGTTTAPQQQQYSCPFVSPPSRVSSCSPPPPPPPAVQVVGNVPPTVVLSPCAACKILRRRCADGCVLAPYFPPTEPAKFTTTHRVFGASNIIKLLQELPESSRADAVSSMVYEAEARLRDPVYGCAGAVCRLQKQANELKVQLARAQADLLNAQAQHANLLALVCVEVANHRDSHHHQQQQHHNQSPLMDGGRDLGAAAYQMFYDSDDLDSATWPDHEAQLWT
ncbi:LOB domain-containing protein 1 [Dichanthelium oligosanthes]|uniref:LOB domain-containing protein 1 n=1 Tax=Dichanthelium oligosanthes TaxID=888268 RepID=A0A1E5VLX9_9POAL|nr:LOB domain-containing protein 1 [Dichanthelium oligosanthes]